MTASLRLHRETIPVDELMAEAIDAYKEPGPFPTHRLERIPFWKKLWNERRLKKLLDQLLTDIEPYLPEIRRHMDDPSLISASTKAKVRTLVTKALQTVDEKQLLFARPFLTHFIDQGYMDAAETFVFKAKQEDPDLTNEEVFQALRNVWIMNSLQLCFGQPLTLTPPMYAYSLLYPYTDNLIDDPERDMETKQSFNRSLEKVLAGETVASRTATERRIFELVLQIKAVYSYEKYPQVTESIQLIHQAQIKSLAQSSESKLSRDAIMAISFLKGGTSVLADAYLIKGNLTKAERMFAFHYGAFLQLLDDLQDSETDKKEHNQTLFSIEHTKKAADEEISRLLTYIFEVNTKTDSDSPSMRLMKDVISQCTLLIVMEAVGKKPKLITSAFYKELEAYARVRLTFYEKLESKLNTFMKN